MDRPRKKTLSKLEKKRLSRIIILIVGLSVLLLIVVPNRSLISYLSMNQQVIELTRENENLVHFNQELSKEIKLLRHDDEHLKKIAREQHGLLKKNETVYKFKSRR